MSFQVKIKNIGKLTDADIRIGDLTVFAGPNNTGKSFVSKLLYSLFNAMNADPIKGYIENLMKSVRYPLRRLSRWSRVENVSISSLFEEINEEFRELGNLVEKCSAGDFEELDEIVPECFEKANKMEKIYSEIVLTMRTKENNKMPRYTGVLFENLSQPLNKLRNAFRWKSGKILIDAMTWKIEQNLIRNFQVSKISDLEGVESTFPEVEIEGSGNFNIVNEKPRFRIKLAQIYSNLLYLESPFYWKLKNALENIRDYPSFRRPGDRERLSGVPEYFYDLARALKFQYTGDMAFPNVYERLTSKDVIGGKMALSETGDLLFHENGRQFPMSLTATGVANLGILALLIERKVLDKGTFLFIDEPEAHLHPAWQVIMAEALFNIAKQGAKVVIATHSPDILQTLEALAKKNPKDQSLIALNQFPPDDNIIEEDFETKMENIMHELTKPFSNQYIESL